LLLKTVDPDPKADPIIVGPAQLTRPNYCVTVLDGLMTVLLVGLVVIDWLTLVLLLAVRAVDDPVVGPSPMTDVIIQVEKTQLLLDRPRPASQGPSGQLLWLVEPIVIIVIGQMTQTSHWTGPIEDDGQTVSERTDSCGELICWFDYCWYLLIWLLIWFDYLFDLLLFVVVVDLFICYLFDYCYWTPFIYLLLLLDPFMLLLLLIVGQLLLLLLIGIDCCCYYWLIVDCYCWLLLFGPSYCYWLLIVGDYYCDIDGYCGRRLTLVLVVGVVVSWRTVGQLVEPGRPYWTVIDDGIDSSPEGHWPGPSYCCYWPSFIIDIGQLLLCVDSVLLLYWTSCEWRTQCYWWPSYWWLLLVDWQLVLVIIIGIETQLLLYCDPDSDDRQLLWWLTLTQTFIGDGQTLVIVMTDGRLLVIDELLIWWRWLTDPVVIGPGPLLDGVNWPGRTNCWWRTRTPVDPVTRPVGGPSWTDGQLTQASDPMTDSPVIGVTWPDSPAQPSWPSDGRWLTVSPDPAQPNWRTDGRAQARPRPAQYWIIVLLTQLNIVDWLVIVLIVSYLLVTDPIID